MYRLFVFVLLSGTLCAAERPDLLAISQASFAVATAADSASSWGLYETNPILGNGTFGAKQAAVHAGITSALIAAESVVVRRHPSLRKAFTVVNFAATGVLAGAVASNLRQR